MKNVMYVKNCTFEHRNKSIIFLRFEIELP